ncbi:DMT family transporter [uncultured Hymenobacter sp.]|uniref:DMT family transporter n=1 Tax=uncultured Hymenobacter sp. TaxID=170016 RepID=UPI0035CA6FB2
MGKLSPGVRAMLWSTFWFALLNVSVKLLHRLPALEIILFRSVFSLSVSYAALWRSGRPAWGEPNHRRELLTRSATGAVALALYYITLQEMPLATAVVLQYLAPVFTAVLGIWWLGEKLRTWQLVFFLMAFLGVVWVQGVDARVDPLYVGLGILSAGFSALSYNAIRKLRGRADPLVVVFYSQMIITPLAALYCMFHWVQPLGWPEWAALLATGVFTQLSQLYKTKAYQASTLASVSSLDYLGLIYALIFGYVVFGETFPPGSYAGMVQLLLGVGLNAWYTSRQPKPVAQDAVA